MHKQHEKLGEIIKVARENSKMTVEELTERIGISERYLYRIENEGKVPKFDVLYKLVRELSIDPRQIFYPEMCIEASDPERLSRMLYRCDERSLSIISATIVAALDSQPPTQCTRADGQSTDQ